MVLDALTKITKMESCSLTGLFVTGSVVMCQMEQFKLVLVWD